MPIRVDMLANTRDAVRGVKDYGDALDGVSDSLDDVARDAQRSGDRVADSLKDAAKDGEQAADRLERSFKVASDATADDYKAATARMRAETDKLNQSTREGFHGAGEATGEFKDEALSNFSEVTSSFTGDMQSITDLAQGTFGGLASMGGPASLVFGGLAVAVGLVGQAISDANEDSDELEEKLQGIADTRLGDFLNEYGDSGDALARGLRRWATDADSFGGSLNDLRKNTREGGLEFADYAQAIATQSIPRLKELRREVEAHIKKLDEQAGAQRAAGNGSSALANQLAEQSDAARAVKEQLDQNLDVNDKYEGSLRAIAKAQGLTVTQYQRMLDKQAESQAASEEYADGVQSAYADAGSSIDDYVEDGVFNLDRYAEATQKNLETIVNYQRNMSDAQGVLAKEGHDTAIQYLEQLGPDAAPLIDAFVNAPIEKQAQLAAIWDQLGATGASSFGTKLQTDLDAGVTRKTVIVDADTSAYDYSLDAILKRNLNQTVDVFVNNPQNRYVAPRRDVP